MGFTPEFLSYETFAILSQTTNCTKSTKYLQVESVVLSQETPTNSLSIRLSDNTQCHQKEGGQKRRKLKNTKNRMKQGIPTRTQRITVVNKDFKTMIILMENLKQRKRELMT